MKYHNIDTKNFVYKNRGGFVEKKGFIARGFIALMSAIIISAVLLVLAVTGSLTGYYSRTNALDSEYKEKSLALAEACASQALIELVRDSAYAGDSTTTVATGELCYIGTVSGTTQKTFRTRGIYQNAYTNLEVGVSAQNLAIVAYREVENL